MGGDLEEEGKGEVYRIARNEHAGCELDYDYDRGRKGWEGNLRAL